MVRVNAQDVLFFGFDTTAKRYNLPGCLVCSSVLQRSDTHGGRGFQDALYLLKERFRQWLAFALQQRRLFA